MHRLFAALLVLAPGLATGQTTPGYTPCADPAVDKPVIGVWLHDAVETHGAFRGTHVWTQLELRTDGEAIEDYFTADPTQNDLPPFARVFSTWTSGTFVDPEAAKGTFKVIRFAPYLSLTLRADTGRYAGLRGGFIPVFRRFDLSMTEDEIALWSSVVLVLPGSTTVATLPADLEITTFQRLDSPATAVEEASWGQIKTLELNH